MIALEAFEQKGPVAMAAAVACCVALQRAPAQDQFSPASSEEAVKKLVELEAQLEETLAEKVDPVHATAVKELNERYAAALERELAKATRAADLDTALALRKEKTRIENKERPPETDPAGIPDELQRLRKIYRDSFAEVEKKRLRLAEPLFRAHDAALAELQGELTRAGELDSALAVRKAREDLAARMAGSPSAARGEQEPPFHSPAATPEEIAKWALSLGAELEIRDRKDEQRIHRLDQIPSGRFDIVSLAFPDTPVAAELTDEELERLAGLDKLESFTLKDAAVQGPALRIFGRLSSLADLDLSGNPIDGAALRHLANHPNLERLDLREAKLNDPDVAPLATLPNLRRLVLSDCGLSSACLPHLKDAPKLELLGVNGNRMSGPRLAALTEFPALTTLRIGEAGLVPSDMTVIARLTDLEQLECGSNPGAEAAYGELAALTKLRYFGCHGDFTGENFAELADWKHLEFLRVWGCRASDSGVATIVETFPGLNHLHLAANEEATVTPAGVGRLRDFKEIATLTLSGLPVDQPALEAIASRPSLHHLLLAGTRLEAFALSALRRARGLKSLAIRKCELADGCLDVLATLDGLEKLTLEEVAIPPPEVATLKEALRDTEIRVSQ